MPREFVVKETSSGRFHLAGFGVTCGGMDRATPFVLVVQDQRGREIGRSHPTTAQELGIAERGRGDYDLDKFHRTDFLKVVGGRLVPSAQARRAAWSSLG